MLNSARQANWYYAVCINLIGIILSILIFVIFHKNQTTLNHLENIVVNLYASLGGFLVITLALLAISNLLLKSTQQKIRWIIAQPFMWQFAVYVFVAIIVFASTKVSSGLFKNPAFSSLSIGTNTANGLFLLYLIALLIGVIFKK